MKKLNQILVVLCLILTKSMMPAITWSTQQIDEHTTRITALFEVPADDFVYQDYLQIECDSPQITLSPFTLSQKSVEQYDPRFKEQKKQLQKSFELSCIAEYKEPLEQPVGIHLSYFQHSNKQIKNELFQLAPTTQPEVATSLEVNSEVICTPSKENPCAKKCVPAKSWSTTISDLITHTDSLLVRILLVILLGILMSLTPCIYPMIPITVGILQSQATGSWIHNFTRALAYTMGIATTFAILGLLAAFTGQVFGSIMANPIFIIFIVLLLLYLAGSMLGLYEMYIPSFMQPKHNGMHGSSLLAAFIFGAASGTIASPCLSPGLILLLTLVTTLGSKFLGFLLLFAFGIGLSIPLLLIGTFSSSLNVLPRSGMWMVEIKRVFGLIMILMCFYFLSNIIAWHILLWMMAAFLLITGIFYLSTIRETHSSSGRYLKNIMSVSLIAASIFMAALAFKATIIANRQESNWWLSEYHKAISVATQNKKLVFLDITAPYCSICKAIDTKLLSTQQVREAICAIAIPVKIDIAQETEETKHLKSTFGLMGAPVFLLIDPANEAVVARWGGEIYEHTVEEFVKIVGDAAHIE